MKKESTGATQKKTIPCHIHTDFPTWENKDDVRQKVCRDLLTRKHSDGNHYCLLHKPDNNKDDEAFQEIIYERISEVNDRVKKIKTLPEAERNQAQKSLNYDFRYVWFPNDISFYNVNFDADADFRSAKIEESAQVVFLQTSFQKEVSFNQLLLKGYLHFEAGKGEFFDVEWKDEKKGIPKSVQRWTSVFEDKLDFSQIRADRPERITFNKVRLRPSWFVNTDTKKSPLPILRGKITRAGRKS